MTDSNASNGNHVGTDASPADVLAMLTGMTGAALTASHARPRSASNSADVPFDGEREAK